MTMTIVSTRLDFKARFGSGAGRVQPLVHHPTAALTLGDYDARAARAHISLARPRVSGSRRPPRHALGFRRRRALSNP